MAGGGGGSSGDGPRELDQTPTWAVSTVCGVIILISIVLELMIHKIGEVNKNLTQILNDCSTFLTTSLIDCSFAGVHGTKEESFVRSSSKDQERYQNLELHFSFFPWVIKVTNFLCSLFCRANGFRIHFSVTNIWTKLHRKFVRGVKIRPCYVLLWSVRWSK